MNIRPGRQLSSVDEFLPGHVHVQCLFIILGFVFEALRNHLKIVYPENIPLEQSKYKSPNSHATQR